MNVFILPTVLWSSSTTAQLLSLYSFVFLVLPSYIKTVSVTASLPLIKKGYIYLCLKGQGQKTKNEAWGKVGLKVTNLGSAFCQKQDLQNKTKQKKQNLYPCRLPTCYICDYFPQFSLICMYISYINQKMTTFLKQVHTLTRKAPYSFSPMYFFLNNPRMWMTRLTYFLRDLLKNGKSLWEKRL